MCADPHFRVKCLTLRDATDPAASALAKLGAELVVGTLDEPETYRAALSGCDAAFLNTT